MVHRRRQPLAERVIGASGARILRELDLLDHVQILDADVRDLAARLPDGFAPIDLTWIDAIVCLYFFENRWELVNPDGGIVLMHYLTYPEGEAVLEYIAEFQRTAPASWRLSIR